MALKLRPASEATINSTALKYWKIYRVSLTERMVYRADFLVSTGDRAHAEATARAYAEWYPAGSAERKYWLAVFRAIRSRP